MFDLSNYLSLSSIRERVLKYRFFCYKSSLKPKSKFHVLKREIIRIKEVKIKDKKNCYKP